MATVTTEAASGRIAEPKATAGKTGTVPRRRRGPRAAEPSTARFFLIKTSGNGTVELGQEVASESFKIRSIDPLPGQPWTYQAFGVKEVHRVRNKSELTDRIVAKYEVRLIQDRRTERVPSGLLVAEYREEQMVGEKDIGLLQGSTLLGNR